ncbi:MAG: DUF488 domain-containing protein [Sedimentisphaerales bacterium]|nr:DUF488 domain-containing protein [Sedimentisphaerales bacterium]
MYRKLYTIGYEGLDINSFVKTLQDEAINCILDVRELPLSRKKGFSKNSLADKLNEKNINYIHFKELGSPSDLRKILKETKNYSTFFKKMSQYIDSNSDVIHRAHEYVLNNTCCLMCFEKYHYQCHRSIVAKKIKKYDGNGLKVLNI